MESTDSVSLSQTRSPRALFIQRFRKEKTAVFGLVTIVLFVLMALLAPAIAPYDPL